MRTTKESLSIHDKWVDQGRRRGCCNWAKYALIGVFLSFGPASGDEGIGELEEKYRMLIRTRIGPKHQLAVEDLNTKYQRALKRELDRATADGRLEDAVLLNAELGRVQWEDDFKEEAEKGLVSPVFQKLRAIRDKEMEKLSQVRRKAAEPIVGRFDAELADLQAQLTRAGDLDGALAVRAYRKDSLLDKLLGPAESAHLRSLREIIDDFDKHCLVYYPLDREDLGIDRSARGNHAEISGPGELSTADANRAAMDFSKGAVVASSTGPLGIQGDSPRSVCAWVTLGSLENKPDSKRSVLFSIGNENHDGARFAIMVFKQDRRVWHHGRNRDVTFNPALPVDEWVHLAITYDGEEMTLFANGRAAPAKPLQLDTVDTGLCIGGSNPMLSFYAHWEGKVCDFLVFDRELSRREVRRVFELGRCAASP